MTPSTLTERLGNQQQHSKTTAMVIEQINQAACVKTRSIVQSKKHSEDGELVFLVRAYCEEREQR
jgi:hypothetical protein